MMKMCVDFQNLLRENLIKLEQRRVQEQQEFTLQLQQFQESLAEQIIYCKTRLELIGSNVTNV